MGKTDMRLPGAPELARLTRGMDIPGGWAQSGKLTTFSSQKVNLAVNFTEADSYSIQVGFSGDNAALRDKVARLEVFWTINGVTIRRLYSAVDGLTVSGRGESVKARLSDATIVGAPQDYFGTILLSKGVRPSTQQPPTLITEPDDIVIAPASSQTIDVPTDAGVISVFITAYTVNLATPPAAGDFVVRHLTGGAGMEKVYDVNVITGWVPIGPGTNSIQLRNNNAANSRWSLTWGIDG